jgi:serine/threonine-protein kinase HipA
LFGAFKDASPNSWGIALINANNKGVPFTPFDYLLEVNDCTRQGALRFSDDNGVTFQKSEIKTESIDNIKEILEDVNNFEKHNYKNLQRLVDTASSMGGSYPKATVKNSNNLLMLAKFYREGNLTTDTRFEAVGTQLASLCKIETPKFSLITIKNVPVFLSTRFDRSNSTRIPYLSATSMLNISNGNDFIYNSFAENIKDTLGVKQSIEIFKRVCFSLLIKNDDDHSNNWGFLRNNNKWELSPMFDINPSAPLGINSNATPLDINDDPYDRDIRLLIKNIASYGISKNEAYATINFVAKTIKNNWVKTAKQFCADNNLIDNYKKIFENKNTNRIDKLS